MAEQEKRDVEKTDLEKLRTENEELKKKMELERDLFFKHLTMNGKTTLNLELTKPIAANKDDIMKS